MCIVLSNFIICIPLQKEPNVSHGVSLSSIMKLGSMAFQSLRFSREDMMQPLSVHGFLSSRLLLLSNPIAELLRPNVEHENAMYQRLCHRIMSGAQTWP